MEHYSWIPLALSAAGAVIAAMASLLVVILTALAKSALTSVEKRLDKIENLQPQVNRHETLIAEMNIRTQNDITAMVDLRDDVAAMVTKLNELSDCVTELATIIRRQTPSGGTTKPNYR